MDDKGSVVPPAVAAAVEILAVVRAVAAAGRAAGALAAKRKEAKPYVTTHNKIPPTTAPKILQKFLFLLGFL